MNSNLSEDHTALQFHTDGHLVYDPFDPAQAHLAKYDRPPLPEGAIECAMCGTPLPGPLEPLPDDQAHVCQSCYSREKFWDCE